MDFRHLELVLDLSFSNDGGKCHKCRDRVQGAAQWDFADIGTRAVSVADDIHCGAHQAGTITREFNHDPPGFDLTRTPPVVLCRRMSQLRNVSSQSLGTPPDLSLSSIGSTSFSSPARTNSPRPTSTTTQSTAPSSADLHSASQQKRPAISTDETALSIRRLSNLSYGGEGDDADVLDTPRKGKKWSLDDDPITPHPSRKSRQSVPSSKSATNLTLRDQEKVYSYILFTFLSTPSDAGLGRDSILIN